MEFEEAMMARAAVQGDEKAQAWLDELDARTAKGPRKHMTTIFVYTDEDVTPDFLAMRIAQTTGCLRPGESVRALGSENEYIIGEQSMLEQIEESLGGPLFGRNAQSDCGWCKGDQDLCDGTECEK